MPRGTRWWAWVLCGLCCVGGGCAREIPPEVDDWPLEIVDASEVHRLADQPLQISLTGRVEAQAGSRVLLSDGTAHVWVELAASLPPLGAGPLGLRAIVERRRDTASGRDTVRVRALEWWYDPSLDDSAPRRTSPASP